MKRLFHNKQKILESIVLTILFFAWSEAVYLTSRMIAQSFFHYDMTTAFDQNTPFLPWTVLIYFGCYLFWAVNCCLCAWDDPQKRDRFFCADALGKLICMILFIAIPTTNIRPAVSEDPTIGNLLMRFLYSVDSADNLFPSIHCFSSWLCWIGIRKRKDIPIAYRIFSLVFAIAVCISTLTTKQHVIADVGAGILLAELAYFIAGFPKFYRTYGAMLSKLLSIFKKKEKQVE